MHKVSFVCTTYRRFTCVRRILAQFYLQTYPKKELIIFNTDSQFPIVLETKNPSVVVINNSLDYITGLPYTNRGQICRDAVKHATGDFFMLADDDDIYLPWHLEQAVDGILETGKDAWKPEKSFFATPDKIEMCMNTLEASVIVKMERIREIGFRTDLTGYEGLSWYTRLRDEGQLDEHNKKYVPSYCFNWGDPHEISGHKQSGDINNPENFENHKKASTDYAFSKLEHDFQLQETYKPYFTYLLTHRADFETGKFEKYVDPWIRFFFSEI